MPVLGRVPSGQRQVATVELCQDLAAIRHIGVCHPSESGWQERRSLDPSSRWHVGFARRPHSVTSTECGRRESEVTGINPGSQERRAVRDIAPIASFDPLVTLMYQPFIQRAERARAR